MDEDGSAFRFVARLKAAIEDYEAGHMTYTQLVVYVHRISHHF